MVILQKHRPPLGHAHPYPYLHLSSNEIEKQFYIQIVIQNSLEDSIL